MTDSTEGRKKHKSCTYDDRVLPNCGTGETRAKNIPCRENLAKQKAKLSNAVKR